MIAPLLLTLALVVTPTVPIAVVADRNDPVQTGVQDSYYQGEFYRKSQEPIRKCIGQREGRFQYWGTGNSGFFEGTYQVTVALAVGAGFMMRNELRETPAHKWHRFYQDMMFFTVANWRGDGVGLTHWRGGRYGC